MIKDRGYLKNFIIENSPLGSLDFEFLFTELGLGAQSLDELKEMLTSFNEKNKFPSRDYLYYKSVSDLINLIKNGEYKEYILESNRLSYDLLRYYGMNELDLEETKKTLYI